MNLKNNFYNVIVATLFAMSLLAQAQSPNMENSMRALVGGKEDKSSKNIPGGYLGINTNGFVEYTYIFPDFSTTADGAVWVKSGSTMVPVVGSGFSSNQVSAQGVSIGLISGGNYGLFQSISSRALFLNAGSANNKVYVALNQSIGGVAADNVSYRWSINPSGIFALSGGTMGGTLGMSGNSITNFSTLTGTNGNITITSTNSSPKIIFNNGALVLESSGGYGVEVPNVAITISNQALNQISANLLYGRTTVGSTNNWLSHQVLSGGVSFLPGAIPISAVNGFYGFFDTTNTWTAPQNFPSNSIGLHVVSNSFNKTGDTMSGILNMSGNRITGLPSPAATNDAVNLLFLSNSLNTVSNSLTAGISSAVSNISITPTAPLMVSNSSAGTFFISAPNASATNSGFLSFIDFLFFTNSIASNQNNIISTSNTLNNAILAQGTNISSTSNALYSAILAQGTNTEGIISTVSNTLSGEITSVSNVIVSVSNNVTTISNSLSDLQSLAITGIVSSTASVSVDAGTATIEIPIASSTNDGMLSANDFKFFNTNTLRLLYGQSNFSGSVGGTVTGIIDRLNTTNVLTFVPNYSTPTNILLMATNTPPSGSPVVPYYVIVRNNPGDNLVRSVRLLTNGIFAGLTTNINVPANNTLTMQFLSLANEANLMEVSRSLVTNIVPVAPSTNNWDTINAGTTSIPINPSTFISSNRPVRALVNVGWGLGAMTTQLIATTNNVTVALGYGVPGVINFPGDSMELIFARNGGVHSRTQHGAQINFLDEGNKMASDQMGYSGRSFWLPPKGGTRLYVKLTAVSAISNGNWNFTISQISPVPQDISVMSEVSPFTSESGAMFNAASYTNTYASDPSVFCYAGTDPYAKVNNILVGFQSYSSTNTNNIVHYSGTNLTIKLLGVDVIGAARQANELSYAISVPLDYTNVGPAVVNIMGPLEKEWYAYMDTTNNPLVIAPGTVGVVKFVYDASWGSFYEDFNSRFFYDGMTFAMFPSSYKGFPEFKPALIETNTATVSFNTVQTINILNITNQTDVAVSHTNAAIVPGQVVEIRAKLLADSTNSSTSMTFDAAKFLSSGSLTINSNKTSIIRFTSSDGSMFIETSRLVEP